MKLSEKQDSILKFIKDFQEEKGRNPRLTELTSEFKISNSAVIQRLKSLEKQKLIDMPEGVLSISTRPRFDVFISYSRKDKKIAKNIFDRLQNEGFRVWKDDSGLKTGDYFASEIFKAIRSSKIFLVLLSDDSIQSKFVKEELLHAKSYSIYNDNPKIFPVAVKKLTLEVFPEILSIHRFELLDFDDEVQVIHFLDNIQAKAYRRVSEKEIKSFNSGFNSFKLKVLKDLKKKTKKNEDYDYFEFFLKPLRDPQINTLMKVEEILEKTVVKLQRWGGFNLPPFYQNSNNLETNPTQNDLRFFKEFEGKEAWLRTWELYSFYMDKKGNFFYRNSLRESYSRSEKIIGKLSVDWLVLDVTRTMMFAKKLVDATSCKKWKLMIHYHGLKGKILTILNSKRHDLFMNYQNDEENDYNAPLVVDSNFSITEASFNVCYEALWLLGWKNVNEKMIKSDIASIEKGIFPE